MKVTSGSESDKGTASWNIESEKEQSLVLAETQKQGYTLFRHLYAETKLAHIFHLER